MSEASELIARMPPSNAPHAPEKAIQDPKHTPAALSKRLLGMLKGLEGVTAKTPKALEVSPGGRIAVYCPYKAQVAGKAVSFWVQIGDVNGPYSKPERKVMLTAYAEEPYGELAKGEMHPTVTHALERAAAVVLKALGGGY